MVEIQAAVKPSIRYSLLVLGLLLSASPGTAQERRISLPAGPGDTSGVVRRDSLALADTLKPHTSPSGVDSVVNYAATDSVVYNLDSRTMFMFGKGDIRYKELGLKAENIDINWNTAILNARGVPDPQDSTGKKFVGLPDMKDGGETYHGSTVGYNFKTKKGRIDIGKTEIERGWYYGDSIKKVEDKVLFVKDGRYTTCDLEHPHYAFFSPEMKVIIGDKVIARPITLMIGDVPVFALPFGVFPTQRGRRSGLIAPAYGESATRGRYLTHLGYFWAMNDYMDINLRGDGYAKGGYTLYSDFRYKLRYDFSGTLSGSYGRTILGERGDPDYSNNSVFNFRWTHNQTFNPTTQLNVDLTFTSGSYYQQTSNNLNDLLRQNVISNATLMKYWEGTPNSMTVNVHRDQNLSTGEVSEILPSLSFNRSQSFPFRSSKKSTGESLAWYDLIGYTYGGQFQNQRTKSLISDSLGFNTDQRWGVNHSLTINASPKAGYFTISPFFDFSSKWYDRSTNQYVNNNGSLVVGESRGFKTVNTFDMGVQVSTKLYGIVRPNFWGITGIRHQMTPSISYVYSPDFSKPGWGYYGRYIDTTGATQVYSRFDKGIFGGAPAGERQAIAFRLGNIFEMKTAGDSVGKENKFQLLNLDLSTSYNFARDSLRFDPISASFRTSIGQLFTIGGSGTFNLYKFEIDPNHPTVGRRVNKFLWSEGKIADLTSFTISVGTRLSGEKKATTAGPIRTAADSAAEVAGKTFIGLYDQETPDFSIPWSLDLNWNFSQTQNDPRVKFIGSGLSAALSFNLTEFWKISASANYDLVGKQFAAPQITVYRDLHCWEMNFSWVPTGYYRNFRLEIRLKAPQLQDIKVTKQGSARDIY